MANANPFTQAKTSKSAPKGKRVSAAQAQKLAAMLKGKSAKPTKVAPTAPVLDDDGDED